MTRKQEWIRSTDASPALREREEIVLFEIKNAIKHHPVYSFYFALSAAMRFER